MGRTGGGGDGGGEPAALEAVRSFERWKKKYSRRTRRLRLQRKERERPEWQVERDGIERLVQRYPQVPGAGSGVVEKEGDAPPSPESGSVPWLLAVTGRCVVADRRASPA